MKFKVVRRLAKGPYPEGTEPEVYDIYNKVGVFPLLKKWRMHKSSLDRQKCLEYLNLYILDLSSEVIIDC